MALEQNSQQVKQVILELILKKQPSCCEDYRRVVRKSALPHERLLIGGVEYETQWLLEKESEQAKEEFASDPEG